MIGFSFSQIHFVRSTLPEIVQKAIHTSYELKDPKKLIEHLSDDQTDQRIALKHVIRRMFGPRSSPPSNLIDDIEDFVSNHTSRGFYRENFNTSIHLKPIDKSHPFVTNYKKVSILYFEAFYKAEYEVINVSSGKIPYRIKLNMENYDYDGIPSAESMKNSSCECKALRMTDNSEIRTCDIKQEISTQYPEKLTPQISEGTVVFINWNDDPDSGKREILDKMLTKEINPGEKLKVILEWVMYLKKQDQHEVTASYFTKGFSIKLIAPEYVTTIFRQHFDGFLDPHSFTSPSGITTRVWRTPDLINPNEGGVVVWKSSK